MALGLGPCRILQLGPNGTFRVPITELDCCFGPGMLDGCDFRRILVRPKEGWVKPGRPDALEQLLEYVCQFPWICRLLLAVIGGNDLHKTICQGNSRSVNFGKDSKEV